MLAVIPSDDAPRVSSIAGLVAPRGGGGSPRATSSAAATAPTAGRHRRGGPCTTFVAAGPRPQADHACTGCKSSAPSHPPSRCQSPAPRVSRRPPSLASAPGTKDDSHSLGRTGGDADEADSSTQPHVTAQGGWAVKRLLVAALSDSRWSPPRWRRRRRPASRTLLRRATTTREADRPVGERPSAHERSPRSRSRTCSTSGRL